MLKVALLLKSSWADHDAFLHALMDTGKAIADRMHRADGALRYAQTHPLGGSAFGGTSGQRFDATEEYWFAGEADARRYFAAPEARGFGGRAYLDAAACLEVVGTTRAILDGLPDGRPDTLRIFAAGARRPDLTHAEYRDYWVNRHGPLAMANPDRDHRIQRVEYCPADPLAITGLRIGPFDSSAGLWAESVEFFREHLKSDYYRDVLAPDEKRFGDKTRAYSALSVERGVWERSPGILAASA